MTSTVIKRKVPTLVWLPVGYLLLAAIHALLLQLLPVPAVMPAELAVTLQQQPVTLADIEQSVERLVQLKKLADL
ncbi:hypothetical protein EOE67_16990 [Rheinheimera riviphila]|uniref:Uncharacterized protein n=1 Tax=Rheinheimera riviphila TaxID=1834037 RepID=A0A437QFV7_9GAMM|nr:hypothetical protein [Rheinheimera riviphila]RVU33417.1 hypothetical protein EOE67_16990 [Rheinheimera riviphila]